MGHIEKRSPYFCEMAEKTVVLWGAKNLGPQFLSFFRELSIDVRYFCDNDPSLWGTVHSGVPVISPDQLKQWMAESKAPGEGEIVVQLALHRKYEGSIRTQLEAYGIKEIYSVDSCLTKLKLTFLDTFHEGNLSVPQEEKLSWTKPMFTLSVDDFYAQCEKETLPVLVGQPPKVGDITMMETLKSHGIDYFFLGNQPHWYDKKVTAGRGETIKIITSIREPIARDLSMLFHQISVGDLFHLSLSVDMKEILADNQEQVIRYLLDLHLKAGKGTKVFNPLFLEEEEPFLHCFFRSFSQHILDITQYPMDTEKGYCVMKEGNIEVFLYQLEELNHLLPELSAFLGRDIKELTNANEAKNKWVSTYYKKALETLKLPKDYVDAVYADPYVKHCYGEKKIGQFKEKWLKNL